MAENRHPADETIREGGRKTAWKPEDLESETHDDAITRHRVPGKRNRRGFSFILSFYFFGYILSVAHASLFARCAPGI